ncbi:type II toxin-antitoxin system VapC family toxin [Prosthecobacter sp.]|uniref:type II toxin-antitoxin system VapC family toxin n=1 Tax=Prosthecobacter sp. TaxID=1965333 RepID=UPI003785087F
MRYFDTGVLLKLYLPEPRAAEAVAHVNASGNRPPITPLHELEMRSALRQKAGRGEITLSECETLIAQLKADLDGNVHERARVVWSDVFATAESLSALHSVSTLCRSLDMLHVALARELGATEFCTFDHRQSLMASAAGLIVLQ